MKSPTEDPISFQIPALRIRQPIGDFFVGVISSKRLRDITWFDVRRIEKERDIETYLGIQRPLRHDRVSEISDYVRTVDACFPTAVLLAVPAVCASYDESSKTLTLSNYLEGESEERILLGKIAKVLDGQHRIEGLREYYGDDFEINISIFVDADIAQQAYIFSIVNLAQTKVNKSLVYDLYELAKSRSPQKLCHNIAVALDGHEDSPFFERIKRLGSASEGRNNETLTQATFVQALMRYISKQEMKDRDLYMRGKLPERISKKESKILLFRNMMIDEKDKEIADIVWNYFDAVRLRWPRAWNVVEQGNVLNRTNGFRALMRFLRDAYLSLAEPGQVPSTNHFAEIFKRSKLDDQDFNIEMFPPGSTGESRLHTALLESTEIRPPT